MKKNKEDLKVHLGCGKINIPGFLNVDIDDFPHIRYTHAIDRLPMLKDNSVDLIYCCGTFEYFDRYEVPAVLQEWKRALKTKGILRLSVPNFDAIVKVYRKYHDLDYRGILGPLFGRIEIKTKKGEEVIYQKTVYDFASLKKVLMSAGFKN